MVLFVLNEEAINKARRLVALGEREVNGLARVQRRANPLLEGPNALQGGDADLDQIVEVLAFAVDPIEDLGEVLRQKLDLATGFCDRPD